MRRGIAVLHPAVVTASEEFSSAIEKGRTDRYSTLGESASRFLYRRLEHL
jgi:hypothetical protein